jgi:hypothetical protein
MPRSYEDRKAADTGRLNAHSAKGRDIGPIPDIANIDRREACRSSIRLFCETYNPEGFYLGWADFHFGAIARIEEAVLYGALYALAQPRGSGKTTIVRTAALWAISYGLCRYLFSIGANASKAEDTLAAIKTMICYLPIYGEDFPEIAYPSRRLGGIAQRARGQLCQEAPTLIEWGEDRVILPTVPPPANWPPRWPLRGDGMVPTSNSVISASGLTGDGIRGSLITLPTGESIRPDLVLLDDPQTPESARSPSQNATREQLVSAGVLGMAGPGKTISAVMPCTVIAPDDFIDRILDRHKHPLWRGERTKMLTSMPSDLAAWDRYFEVYRRCAQKEPPNYAEANAYYVEHQVELDAGGEVSWPDRKLPGDVSAIQHAMHFYCRDRRAFFSEYQNDPLPEVDPLPGELTAAEICARVNRHARGVAPARSTRLTLFVDVQQDLLWYAVCAWEDNFTGAVIEASAWPDQRRNYFALRDANPTIQHTTKIGSLEGSLWAALQALAKHVLDRDWLTDGGGRLRVERGLIDSGWGMSTDTVKRFCRSSAWASILLPSKGMGITASGCPVSDWPKKDGERRGLNWIMPAPKRGEARLVLYDANFWKSFTHARLGTPMGEPGAMTLWGEQPDDHRMLAEHLTAEYRVRTEGRGRKVDEWKEKPHRPDNHLLDCVAGCAVAAAMLGASPPGAEEVRPARKHVKYSELHAAKHGKKKAG